MTDSNTTNVSVICSDIYAKLGQFYQEELNSNIILSYKGYFSQDLVNSFAETMEQNLISSGEKKVFVKKVFSILIEGLQNIRVHGDADESGRHFGSFIALKNDNLYKISFGSIVKKEKKNEIKERLTYLNGLSPEETKEFYLNTLTNGETSIRGNAGLGFITMKLKSNSKISHSFYELNEMQHYFTYEIDFHRFN